MAKVKLKNNTRRMVHFNLEHSTFLEQEGANGVGKPEVLTLLPREVQEVDEDALKCIEVAAALRGRIPSLKIVS